MASDNRSAIDRLANRAHVDPEGVPVDSIVEALDHRDGTVRRRAVIALHAVSKTRPERVRDRLSRLAPLLESEQTTIRLAAVRTLANVSTAHPDSVVPYADSTIEFLDDDSALIRQNAVRALHALTTEEPDGVARAIPRLLPLLNADVELTRLYAAATLARVATVRPSAVVPAVESLLEVVENRYEEPTELDYDPSTSPARPNPTAQLDASRANFVDANDRSTAARTREMAAVAIGTVAAEEPEASASALEAHLPRIFDLLGERNPSVRSAIVGTLAYVAERKPAAVRPIAGTLVDLLDEPIAVSGNAAWTLGFLDSDRGRKALRRVIEDESADPDLRAIAEAALADADP